MNPITALWPALSTAVTFNSIENKNQSDCSRKRDRPLSLSSSSPPIDDITYHERSAKVSKSKVTSTVTNFDFNIDQIQNWQSSKCIDFDYTSGEEESSNIIFSHCIQGYSTDESNQKIYYDKEEESNDDDVNVSNHDKRNASTVPQAISKNEVDDKRRSNEDQDSYVHGYPSNNQDQQQEKEKEDEDNSYANELLVSSPWDLEEDAMLIETQAEVGNKWLHISQQLPGRSTTQCKVRFTSLTRASKKEWTTENDSLLLELTEKYKGDVSKMAEHFPMRTKNAVRLRSSELARNKRTNVSIKLPPIGSSKQLFFYNEQYLLKYFLHTGTHQSVPADINPSPQGSGSEISQDESILIEESFEDETV